MPTQTRCAFAHLDCAGKGHPMPATASWLGHPFRPLTEASIVASAKSHKGKGPGRWFGGRGCKAGVDSRQTSEVENTAEGHRRRTRKKWPRDGRKQREGTMYRGPTEVCELTGKRWCSMLRWTCDRRVEGWVRQAKTTHFTRSSDAANPNPKDVFDDYNRGCPSHFLLPLLTRIVEALTSDLRRKNEIHQFCSPKTFMALYPPQA